MDKQTNFSVYVTNLDEYTKGCVKAKWLDLPCTKEEFYDVLNSIEVADYNEDRWFISDVNIDMEFLWDLVKENSDIEQLNYLVILLDELDEEDTRKLATILNAENITNVIEVINLVLNLDKYSLYSYDNSTYNSDDDILDKYNFNKLRKHINYDRNVVLSEKSTSYSYMTYNSGVKRLYNGDIPDEYKIY